MQAFYQGRILGLRVTDDDVVIGEQEAVGNLALGRKALAAVVNDQAVGQQKIPVLGYGEVIDRHFFRQPLKGHPDRYMAAAEPLAIRDFVRLDKLIVCVHNQVGIRTAQPGPVLQLDHLQLVHIFFNADVYGPGVHDLAGIVVI